jgi:hypothetical protein
VRKLEVAANEAFDVYRELYYEGGVGSVYFWDLDDGFAGVILLKKGMGQQPISPLLTDILGVVWPMIVADLTPRFLQG